jgi:signal peptidase I
MLMYKEKAKKWLYATWKNWRLTILFAVFVLIPIKSSLADFNWVPTGSMKPTILEGDLLYVNKAAYDLRFPLTLHRLVKWSDPQKSDIVICFAPDDDIRLVKRVIATPGDTVAMKDNVLIINGKPLDYEVTGRDKVSLPNKTMASAITALENLDGTKHAVMSIPSVQAMRTFAPVTIPDGYYFLMGDNRDRSKDSRTFGLVERKAIVGKAKAVVLSFDIKDNYQPRPKRFLEPIQ